MFPTGMEMYYPAVQTGCPSATGFFVCGRVSIWRIIFRYYVKKYIPIKRVMWFN